MLDKIYNEGERLIPGESHDIEHIPDGINAVLKFYHKKRLIINVPFNEPEGNIHHLINCITEKDFDAYQNKEFFYEGLEGITYPEYSEQNPTNSIICASSADGLSPIKNVINYQIPAWKPWFLENLCFTKAQEYELLQQKYQTLQQKYQTLQQENEQLKQAATYKVKNFIKSFIKHT